MQLQSKQWCFNSLFKNKWSNSIFGALSPLLNHPFTLLVTSSPSLCSPHSHSYHHRKKTSSFDDVSIKSKENDGVLISRLMAEAGACNSITKSVYSLLLHKIPWLHPDWKKLCTFIVGYFSAPKNIIKGPVGALYD